MTARRRVIGLGQDGKLALKSGDGSEKPLPAARLPGSVFLLLDCSGSMAGGKLDQARSGAEDFLRTAVSRGYLVGLVRFDSSAELLHPPTANVERLTSSLARLGAGSSTNMTAAIEAGARNLADAATADRALVLVTDGMPDDPATTLEAARRAARDGIQMIAIGTDDADWDFLRQVATADDLALKVQPKQLGEAIAAAAGLLPRGPE